jgi:hypothetical protein
MAPRSKIQQVEDQNSPCAPIISGGPYTVDVFSADQINLRGRGVIIIADIVAASGAGASMTPKLQYHCPTMSKYVDIPGAVMPAITAPGTYVLVLYPGIGAIANQVVNAILSRNWRLFCTIAGTTPSFGGQITASILQ